MSKHFDVIPNISLQPGSAFSHPPKFPEIIHMDDPALDTLVKLKNNSLEPLSPKQTIDDALTEMKAANKYLFLVSNEQDEIIGLISSEDIQGEKPYQIIQDKRIKRNQITVEMVMVPFNQLLTFDMEELRHAKVGNLVETLNKTGQHYALVVRTEEDQAHTVIGYFVASRISRALGGDVTGGVSDASSLAEFQKNFR